jgi:Predicted glutamine amidotransferase
MATYSLHLAHLYGDLLNTYGDVGNILALRYYANLMDADLTTKVISIEQSFDPDQFDLAFFGGGQDYEQMIVSKDIQTKKMALLSLLMMTNQCLQSVVDINF